MAQTAFILILPYDQEKGQKLSDLLRRRHGHSCRVVTSLDDALNSIRMRVPDVVVAVSPLDGRDPLEPIAALLDTLSPDATLLGLGQEGPPPAPPTQHITYQGLANPADDGDLVDPIGEAARRAVARHEDRLLKQSLELADHEPFEGILGASPAMLRIVERIKRVAGSKLTVLLLGETGTGKEVIARAVHQHSNRARKPFLALNCAGLSETLIESELFGHVKGAFTGAVADRKGHFVAADGGTLFLDEIGDMPMPMQAKLLRVLDHREIMPVGSHEIVRVDVRVIAATNANLQKKIEEREFRLDLYYRLRQFVIEIPPLRDRREDIPLLAHHLLRQANAEHGLNVEGFASEAMILLTKYHWPGNVRELRYVIESVASEVGTGQIQAAHLPEEIRGPRDLVPTHASGSLGGLTIKELQRAAIEDALRVTGGNREQAAKMLKIGTRTLYRKIKEFGIA